MLVITQFKTRMKKTFCFIILIFYSIAFGQNGKENKCELQAQNITWKTEFEKVENKSQQIKLIKEKIKSDSIFSDFQPKIITHDTPTITNEAVDENGNKCGCKILFVLWYSKKKSIRLNLSSKPQLSSILENLNAENIEKIWFVFDKSAEAIYGGQAECGFVQIEARDKKLKRLIEKTVL